MESIKALVQEIKDEMFSSVHLYSLVSPSAYDTAWLALIPQPQHPNRPMFSKCVDWILSNQRKEGFWGEPGHCNVPTIDCLSATLACMVALHRWNIGSTNIKLGLSFIHGNTEKLLKEFNGCYPRWFAIVFTGMIELARTTGINVFPDGLAEVVKNIFRERQTILEMEDCFECVNYPILSYMEVLPTTHDVSPEQILKQQSKDGSLFQSPSATAHAFMVTGNKGCMDYLESMVQRCGYGVPPMYPVDEELIKLSMVNQLERLGLREHFLEEIEEVLSLTYRDWIKQEHEAISAQVVPLQMYKDSLAFRLLRMHGYRVSPRRFCWFLQHKSIVSHMEENCECFLSVMLNIHRATDVMFVGENELEEVRTFSRRLLENGMSMKNTKDTVVMFNIQREIEHELKLPWLARLDHLEHRMNIEGTETHYLWMGKAAYYRLRCLNNAVLLRLAKANYTFRQSIFKTELEEMKRWSKESGLRDIGFGREKTSYCYFAAACIVYHPGLSNVRMTLAKTGTLVTVVDDFFDTKGSLDELNNLTKAVQRWEVGDLSYHSKTIFEALNDLINDIAAKCLDQHGHDIVKDLRELWYETFVSWIKEAEWSRMRVAPSVDEYIETGMISIAAHTMTLSASYLASPGLTSYLKWYSHTELVTKLLMVSTRLLNDIQSYEKENEEGKMNLVLLYLKENPEANIEDSIKFIRRILDKKKKELLEHVLVDGVSDMPKSCKQLHLSVLKVFQMFFNSSNDFDSPTQLLDNINKAIYDLLTVQF
ncbi:(E,E)-geranyllinalool synthase-like [Magnolia sinica]|uniref:(E,E)-geranyllinalool synthase-like n=1 Tax=Magnolia sinica TaxID=86752 RepID=UPI0026589486|nr:(E,E)-geranyllinalool synthase-like [Magnolia sinica]